jgi:hypothetical protein
VDGEVCVKPLTVEDLLRIAKVLENSGLGAQELLRAIGMTYPAQKLEFTKDVAEWLQDECDYSFEE